MKIFLDTADTDIIEKYFSTGLVDGVTTNPTLIMKSGKNPDDVYQKIKDIGVKDISMVRCMTKVFVCIKSSVMYAQSKFLVHARV
jgi:transaldolase